MTRAEPAERAEPVVPGDQGVRADPVAQGGPEDQVAPEDQVVPEALEDRVVVDPAVPGALVEVQVDPAGDRVAPAGTSDASQYSAQSICPNPTLTTCQRIANDRLK